MWNVRVHDTLTILTPPDMTPLFTQFNHIARHTTQVFGLISIHLGLVFLGRAMPIVDHELPPNPFVATKICSVLSFGSSSYSFTLKLVSPIDLPLVS